MAETETATALSRKVQDAVRKAGGKVSELDEQQRLRAEAASNGEGEGLTGKALGEWVLTGQDPQAQLNRLNERVTGDTGYTASDQRQARDLAKAAGVEVPDWAKTRASSNSGEPRASKYPEEIVEQSRKAKELTGHAGPVPKQIMYVRDTFNSPQEALELIEGGISQKELRAIADGSAGKGAGRKLNPIAAKVVPGNAWTRGRNLAATLITWIDMDKRKK